MLFCVLNFNANLGRKSRRPRAYGRGGGTARVEPPPPPHTPPPTPAEGFNETHLDAAKVLALSGTCTARDRKALKALPTRVIELL